MKVILVDDEPMALRALEHVVNKVLPLAERESFRYAREALDYVKNNKIDIAFLDINMRNINGIEMAKQLREEHPHVNIIFCTGYSEYALESYDVAASAYLTKPISEEKMRAAMQQLRYSIEEENVDVYFQCFGNFEVFYKKIPISFEYHKTKEMLAYLVDRKGVDCTTREIMGILFGDEMKMSYFQNIRRDLLGTFTKLGIQDVLRISKGQFGIVREKVNCDYYDYLDGKNVAYCDEYMKQYDFGEATNAALMNGKR